MNWSVSTSKMFIKCQRKWFFYYYIANHKSNDTFRREAYILKQLRTIHAWRGSVVDNIIEKLIVPELKSGTIPSRNQIKNYTINLINNQLKFAKEKKYRNVKISKSKIGDYFCALYEYEYEKNLNENIIEQAINEIYTSIYNLLNSELIIEIKENNIDLYAQPRLNFKFNNVNVVAYPDLIILFAEQKPLIIDWKVHYFANTDAWLQLSIYAYAFINSKINHFLTNPIKDLTEIRLKEYQLLQNHQRDYNIATEDYIEIEDYIFTSSTKMNKLIDNKKYKNLYLDEFNTALDPNYCKYCNFKKLCWKRNIEQKKIWEF